LFQVSTKIVFVISEVYGVTTAFGCIITSNSQIYSPCNIKYDSIALKYLNFRTFLNDTRLLQGHLLR